MNKFNIIKHKQIVLGQITIPANVIVFKFVISNSIYFTTVNFINIS